MGLFSFAGSDSRTLNQALGSGLKDAKTVDSQLELILEFMDANNIDDLRSGISMIEDYTDAEIKYSYGTLAGRALKKLEGTDPSRAEEFKLGLPSSSIIKEMGYPGDYAAGDFSGVGERVLRGGQKELQQILYGLGNVEEWMRDKGPEFVESLPGLLGDIDLVPGELAPYSDDRKAIQKQRKLNVEDIKLSEEAWKSYYATEDPESDSGLNEPWNVAGTIGEIVPGMSVGGVGSMLTKGAMQAPVAFGLNAGLEGLKLEEHGDTTEAAIGTAAGLLEFIPGTSGALKNLNPVSKGMSLANYLLHGARGPATTSKKGISKGAADRGYNAWKMINDNTLSAPYDLVENTKRVMAKVGDESRATPIIQLKKTLAEIQSRGARAMNMGLGAVGESYGDLTKANGTYPLGKLFRDHIQLKKQELTTLGDPYREAYRKVGDNLIVDSKKLLDTEKEYLKDPGARKHVYNAINSVSSRETKYSKEAAARLAELDKATIARDKRINSFVDAEEFGATERNLLQEEITALTKKLGDNPSELATNLIEKKQLALDKKVFEAKSKAKEYTSDLHARNASAFEKSSIQEDGGILDMENLTANNIVDIVENLNAELSGAHPFSGTLSDSTVYQIKQYRNTLRDSLSELPEEFSGPFNKAKEIEKTSLVNFGDEGPVPMIKQALKDKSNKSLEGLFTGDEGLTNLQNVGQIMDSNNPAYRGFVRKNISDRIDPSVSQLGGWEYPVTFDFDKYNLNTLGINWDDYRQILPEDGQAGIDYLSGLGGVDKSVMKGNLNPVLAAVGQAKDPASLDKSPIRDSLDAARVYFSPEAKPYYRYDGNQPTIAERIGTEMKKTQAPESMDPLLMSPASQMGLYAREYLNSDLIVPTKQSEDALSILNDPNFKFLENY